MSEYIYRFSFREGVPMLDVEETFFLSTFAAEGLYGEARVRMDAGYSISQEKRRVVIDAGTPVGQAVCGIFAALALKEFGRESLKVERIPRDRKKEAATKAGADKRRV